MVIIVSYQPVVEVEAADAAVGAHPDVACPVFREGAYVGVFQSVFAAVDAIFLLREGGEANESFAGGCPKAMVAVLVKVIDGVRGEVCLHIKQFPQVERRIVQR